MSVEKIFSEWKLKAFKPVYWLEGEEPYFIDQVVDYAEHKILTESEASFNLTVFYGKDADWAAVINACRRYPMFSERQVVLLKEAQHMKDIDKLEGYVEKPLTSTILIVAYKDKKVDARTKLAKNIKKFGEILTTKKIPDYQMNDWAKEMIRMKGFEINPKALLLLIDHLGNDLSRVENEVDKLALNMGRGKLIDENAIDKYVGISKEFNAFELQAAIAKKDLAKAIRIIQYFESNPKAVPIQLILPALYGYFSKVYSIFGLDSISETTVAPIFYRNTFVAKEAITTSKSFGVQGIEKILLLLHEYNLRSIGVHDGGTSDSGLLKEMVVKMIH